MNILVNGKPREVLAADLASVLLELGYCNALIATALNGEFVANTARAAAQLNAGDCLEIVAPMQGG